MSREPLRVDRQVLRRIDPERLLAALTIIVIPFDLRFASIPVGYVQAPLLLFELPLACFLLVFACRRARHLSWPLSVWSRLWLVLTALLLVSAAIHPSWFTMIRLYRFAAAAGLGCWVFHALSRRDTLLFMALATATLFQTYLAVGEHVLGRGLGYTFLGEEEHLSESVGVQYLRGTFPLHHILAGFTLTGIGLLLQRFRAWTAAPKRNWWLLALGLTTIPIGFAHSRMGLLGWTLVVVVLILGTIRSPARYAVILVPVFLGAATAGLLTGDAWSVRATETLKGDSVDDDGVDVGGRLELARQALLVIRDHPITGTGMGRYVTVAQQSQGPTVELAAHNVPLFVAAEHGIPAGAVVALLLTLAGWAALRHGPLAAAAFLGYLPFVMFDNAAYRDTQSIAIAAIWLGTVRAAGLARSASWNGDR